MKELDEARKAVSQEIAISKALQDHRDDLMRTCDLYGDQIRDLQRRLENATENWERVEKHMLCAIEERNEARSQVANLREEIATRDNQITNLIKRAGEIFREEREIRRERDWLHAESNLRGKDVEKLRAELERVEAALAEYPRIPKETFIGKDGIADKVTWLARRAEMLERSLKTKADDE